MNSLVWSAGTVTFALGLSPFLAGQSIKAEEQSGHVSPVFAKLTFTNGTTRNVLVAGIGGQYRYGTHQLGCANRSRNQSPEFMD